MDLRAIYNSLQPGKSWRALWSKIREESTDPDELRLAAIVPKELPETPELSEAPEAKVESPADVAELVALKKENQELKAQRDNLKHAIGVHPPVSEKKSLLEQFHSLEGEAQAAFYLKHRNALSKAIQTPDPLTTYGNR